MRRISVFLLCALSLLGQANRRNTSSRTAEADKGAWIHGSVVSDLTSQPLLRAQVILRPLTGATNSVVVETDEQGKFVMNRIGPGGYSLTAQRDGYLPNNAPRRGPLRLPAVIQLRDGLHVRDVTFRLRPWAVMSGKVRYDDAEPAVGALVQLFRETVARGRHSMQLITSARTNDRGEYRVASLTPGSYLVAVTRNRPVGPEVDEQEAVDDAGRPITEYRYATTFFPGAQKLADAVPVRIDVAQEVGGIDLYLKPVAAVRIRGRVLNGITGLAFTQPCVTFRRMTADGQSSINVAVSPKPYLTDGFEISGVTSGPYVVTCDADHEGRRIFARRLLTVTDAPIDNLELVLEPEREMPVEIRFDDSPPVPLTQLRVSLEPRSDLSPAASAVFDKKDGKFKARVIPGET